MAGYKSELVNFDVPDGWEDKTIVAFAAPPKPGTFSTNVVLTRDPLKPGETLRSYADRQIMELARRLEGFELEESGDRDIAGRQAMEYRFRWKSDHAELHQHSLLFVAGTEVLTLTGTATHDEALTLDSAMNHVIDSMNFPPPPGYDPTGGRAPAAPPPADPGGRGGWSRR